MNGKNAMLDAIKDIETNKEIFDSKINLLSSLPNLDEKQKLAKKMINYVLNASTSYYSSEAVEKIFTSIAENHSLNNLPSNFIPNSILHVMTESYKVGGHTRVVERWIEYGEKNEMHSLIFTSAEQHCIPKLLISAIDDKRGNITKLPDDLSDLEKGLKLRLIASQYEIVILHVHPHDVVPLIAFGHPEFKRPVIFFNHADHKFWVGGSISDMVVNFRTWGENLCINKRGIKNNFLLSLPIKNIINNEVNKIQVRSELGLNLEKKIVTSVGSCHKYKPITDDKNFLFIVEKLLCDIPDLLFIIIGSSFEDLNGWQTVSRKYNNRLLAIGPQSPEVMFNYLHASDLVIDSYPMSGGTALIDAVTCMKPVLSLDCPTGQLDYVINSSAYCKTENELINKAKEILQDENKAKKNIENVQIEINNHCSMDIWRQKIAELYCNLKNVTHQNYMLTEIKEEKIIDNDIYLYSEYKRIRTKFSIPYLIHFYTLNTNGRKYRVLIIFNKIKFRVNVKKILDC